MKMDSKYFGMINEDHSATANLPQGVMMKEYPKCSFIDGDLDDTIRKIDETRRFEVNKIHERPSKVKY